MPESIRFSGPASLRQGLGGPLGCELRGAIADAPALPVLLRFALRQPLASSAALPAVLQHAQLLLASPATAGSASASSVMASDAEAAGELRAANLPQPLLFGRAMLHRDAEALAEAAIPPRAVRWRTRLFWRVVFLLMRTAYGRSLLLRRYQK